LATPQSIKFVLEFVRLIIEDYKIFVIFAGCIRCPIEAAGENVLLVYDKKFIVQDAAMGPALNVYGDVGVAQNMRHVAPAGGLGFVMN